MYDEAYFPLSHSSVLDSLSAVEFDSSQLSVDPHPADVKVSQYYSLIIKSAIIKKIMI